METRKYSVCFLSPRFFPVGGTSIRTLNFARAIRKQGHDVHIITWQLTDDYPDAKRVSDIFKEGIILHILPLRYSFLGKYFRSLYVLLSGFKYLNWVRQVINANEFDIVHCVMETTFVGVVLKRITKKPIVADLHAVSEGFVGDALPRTRTARFLGEKMMEMACKLVDKVLTPTEELRDLLLSRGLKPEKVTIVKNAIAKVDVKKSRAQVRAELNVPEKTILVAFHGVLVNDYNIEALCHLGQISRIMSKQLKDEIKFLVLGRYKVVPVKDENFIYVGYVENLHEYLNAVDFAIVPIVSNSFGIRSRLLDYFAMSVPVLTTPVGVTGMKFACESGAVVVKNSLDQLAQSAVELARSPRKLKEMRKRSKMLVECFSSEKIAKDLISLYSQIVPN